MSRWLLPIVFCVACGDNLAPAAPDAALPDAPSGPDASLCAAGEASCDGTCIPVTDDEANCGGCESCNGGEVCTDATCKCPTSVVPPAVFSTGIEQFFELGPITLTLAPALSAGGASGVVFGHDASIQLNTDIDLSTIALGSPPFVAALAGLDIMGLKIDASYVATAGTLKFSKRCSTQIVGTLKNATFNGVGGGILDGTIPTIDPNGCVIKVASMSFSLMTAPCPEPEPDAARP